MRQIAYLAFSLLIFTACEDITNTATTSSTTFLPKMDLQGSPSVVVECDETYTDAGVEVTEGGNPIDFETAVSGAYFGGSAVDGADAYTVAYSAVNVDGIPGSAFRDVVVEPCNTGEALDIAGLYTSDVVRDTGEGYVVSDVFVVRTGDNTFAISDLCGGFYDKGKGYGPDYACLGSVITVNSASDITVSQGQFPVWGNTIDITGITLDGNTITVDVLADFGSEWSYTLTRQ